MKKKCIICGNNIKMATKNSKVCRGYYLGGSIVRSACDIENRRRKKIVSREAIREGKRILKARKRAFHCKLLVVKKLEPKKRNCLRCGTDFVARGDYNRICSCCSTKDTKHHELIGMSIRSEKRLNLKGVVGLI